MTRSESTKEGKAHIGIKKQQQKKKKRKENKEKKKTIAGNYDNTTRKR